MASKEQKTKLTHPILGDIISLKALDYQMDDFMDSCPTCYPFLVEGPRISNAPLFISPAINSIAQLQYFGLRMQIYDYFHFDQFTLLLFPPYEAGPCLCDCRTPRRRRNLFIEFLQSTTHLLLNAVSHRHHRGHHPHPHRHPLPLSRALLLPLT